jgi:hypothetical protein
MSHYNVNAGVAKTLIQHLIGWAARREEYGPAVSKALLDVLNTEISPELIPAGEDGAIQSTEDAIGPYPLAMISSCTMWCVTDSAPPRSPFWRKRPGATRRPATGRLM